MAASPRTSPFPVVFGNTTPISTAFVESAVNEIIAIRMNKKQQMRWNRTTVQPFLDVRCAVRCRSAPLRRGIPPPVIAPPPASTEHNAIGVALANGDLVDADRPRSWRPHTGDLCPHILHLQYLDRGPVGLPQVLGSCGYRHWWVRVVGWPEPLYKVGTESAIIDSATNLKQQIRATSRPSHLL